MKLTINPEKRVPQHIEGRYLRVLDADGDFVISGTGVTATTVRNREVVDLGEPRDLILENRGAVAINIDIEAAGVPVTGMDQVLLAEGSKVDFVPGASIDVGQVQIATDAQIAIKDGSSVAISNLPAVQEVNGLVDLGSVPDLSISSLPPVQLAEKVEIDKTGQLQGLPVLEYVNAGLKTVTSNVNRKLLEVKADIGNTGTIWVGGTQAGEGLPLGQGEAYSGEITESLNLYGDTIGDKVYLAEVV